MSKRKKWIALGIGIVIIISVASILMFSRDNAPLIMYGNVDIRQGFVA